MNISNNLSGNVNIKPQAKSKTNWFGIALATFAGVQQYAPQIQAELSPTAYNLILFGAGIGVVVLRQVTKGPVR